MFKNNDSHLVLGLMSGTSLDGVDLALVKIEGSGAATRLSTEHFITLNYPSLLQDKIRSQMIPESSSVEACCALHVELGQFFGEMIVQQLEEWGVAADEVDAIGSHGHTLYHIPEGRRWDGAPQCSTFQAGDGDSIAFRTGILTISDFRAKDVAAGGSGAPLLPYVDFLIFEKSGQPRVLHNLGGISNLTWLAGSGIPEDVIAFDTGPANVLINLAAQTMFDVPFDPQGSYAAQGSVHKELLQQCLAHPFFRKKPVKSTGRELFGENFFAECLQKSKPHQLSSFDIIATLTALTSHSIAQAYHNYLPQIPDEVYFSGGGVQNQTLMKQIQELLPQTQIQKFNELGMHEDAREAVSFAVLANELISGNTVTFKGITGNPYRTKLGKVSFP